jgi:predicted hotdog family 3-hydroxylacyl-ACP dehydratase
MKPVPMDSLVPHRPPMQWVNTLIDCTDTAATATACLQEGDFAVADGLVMETALAECVAQTVAAAIGQRAKTSGKTGWPGAGMLTGVSNFRVQSRPPAGKTLQIEIRELKRLGPMLMIAGVVSCEGQVIASGELTLYA